MLERHDLACLFLFKAVTKISNIRNTLGTKIRLSD